MIASLTYLITHLLTCALAHLLCCGNGVAMVVGWFVRRRPFFWEQSPPTAAESIIAGQTARNELLRSPCPRKLTKKRPRNDQITDELHRGRAGASGGPAEEIRNDYLVAPHPLMFS